MTSCNKDRQSGRRKNRRNKQGRDPPERGEKGGRPAEVEESRPPGAWLGPRSNGGETSPQSDWAVLRLGRKCKVDSSYDGEGVPTRHKMRPASGDEGR